MIRYSLLVVFTLMLIALSAQTSNQKKLTEEVQTILAGLPHLVLVQRELEFSMF